jgi:hypothetical protein
MGMSRRGSGERNRGVQSRESLKARYSKNWE